MIQELLQKQIAMKNLKFSNQYANNEKPKIKKKSKRIIEKAMTNVKEGNTFNDYNQKIRKVNKNSKREISNTVESDQIERKYIDKFNKLMSFSLD